MSGMQDVASLANQYQTLAERAKILQSTVGRLKKEVSESYDVVNLKTQELERIHETNFILNQFRQFVKAKSQLEQYLKNEDDKGQYFLIVFFISNCFCRYEKLSKCRSNHRRIRKTSFQSKIIGN